MKKVKGRRYDDMKKCKKNCVFFLCLFVAFVMSFLVGCSSLFTSSDKKEIDFPVDDKGYPKNNIVVINNKTYPIELVKDKHIDAEVDCEIKVKLDEKTDVLEVLLPKYIPINSWSIDEKVYSKLLLYSKSDVDIKDENMIEGVSATVQKFKFQVSKDKTTEILLKWSNIDEMDKLFKDKKEDYLLRIVVL